MAKQGLPSMSSSATLTDTTGRRHFSAPVERCPKFCGIKRQLIVGKLGTVSVNNFFPDEDDKCEDDTVKTNRGGSSARKVNEDEPTQLPFFNHQQQSPYWEEFDKHLKQINDDSNKFLPTKITLKSSETFTRVAEELRKQRTQNNISHLGANMQMKRFMSKRLVRKEEEKCGSASAKNQNGSDVGKRGWEILREKFQEYREKKKNATSGDKKWLQFANQASAIAASERTRRDLYERYGVISSNGKTKPVNTMVPKINTRFVSSEFLVNYKKMKEARARTPNLNVSPKIQSSHRRATSAR